MPRSSLRWYAAVAALFTLGCGESEPERGRFEARAVDGTLKIATWNMEWLHRDNGAGHVPRDSADYQRLSEYADMLDADIIAVQEVDGPEAAARVFDPAVYDFHMSSRNNLQRTGFAYRKSLDVTTHPDYTALDLGNLRYGTDLEVEVGGQSLRLLDVHLKSGCFSQSLGSGSSSCNKLAQQIGPLEDWIDARAAEGQRFMVLGDFNRRLFASGSDDVWQQIDDGSPAGADLSSPTSSGTALCNGGQYPEFIDHLVTGSLATEAVVAGSFDQLLYTDSNSFELSDHCPISIELALGDDPGEPGPSCEGACGGQSSDGCWCDSQCATYGDCCPDKAATCDAPPPPPPPPSNSCEGSCGEQAPGGCWCDDQCESFGNCCADKAELCDAPPPPPDPNSCAGSCGAQASGGCWCDSQCANYGDCCADKQAECG